ncbi:hypothetical protein E4P42_18800 [Mycobacterium sp. PS03-16]|uniref:hypothetical protein n=1 Tax=Mycobacterium sp. PS03-16 TaxID=2559611 RepID=UPI001073E77D|nr:hypothetical protein [Mycobacterium sp. PS03-16]TFV56624.1 hypothetical protein E4P42_18800 [Mycobacterium sp. PS03-16]
MKKFGLVGIVASALSAAVIGFAGPAQADDGYGFGGHGDDRIFSMDRGDDGQRHRRDRDHRNNPWYDLLVPNVKVPHVDTTVRN